MILNNKMVNADAACSSTLKPRLVIFRGVVTKTAAPLVMHRQDKKSK
jgi:hypothetical protein